jgi:signal peptidase I
MHTAGNLGRLKIAAVAALCILLLSHLLFLILPYDRYDQYFILFRTMIIGILAIFFAIFYPEKRLRFPVVNDITLTVSLFGSILFVAFLFILGLFLGFSDNPSVSTMDIIIKNLWCFVFMAVFREYVRCRIIAILNDKPKLIFVISLVFTFSFLDNIREMISLPLVALINAIMHTLFPILVLNIFLCYLASEKSTAGNMLWIGMYQAVFFISPILPGIPKILEAIAVITTVLIMYILMQSLQHKQNHKLQQTEHYPWQQFIFTSTLGIVLIMFVLGVFSYVPMVVVSESMKGTFSRGDVVIVHKIKPADAKNTLQIGEIIEYKSENGLSIIHRIIEIRGSDSTRRYITKGDNNPIADDMPVKPEQIIGVAGWYIPYIGYPTLFLTMR